MMPLEATSLANDTRNPFVQARFQHPSHEFTLSILKWQFNSLRIAPLVSVFVLEFFVESHGSHGIEGLVPASDSDRGIIAVVHGLTSHF